MPIYEYRCSNCNQTAEFIQKVNDKPETTCPHCQANALTKLVSSSRFQLKGTGWYVTDFRDQNKTKQPPADKAATDKTATEKPTTSTDNTDKTK